MTTKFEYEATCRGDRLERVFEIEAETIAEAAEKALRELDNSHPSIGGLHEIVAIKAVGEVEEPEVEKKFALRVNEEIKTARILVQPVVPGSDYWYDLEDATYLGRLARDFKALEDQGYELVHEDEIEYSY